MLKMRCLAIGLVTMGFVATASADFDGPAPLAWRWAQSTTTLPAGSPLIVGDTVYISVGSRVYALDRSSGNQKWRFPVAEPLDGNFHATPTRAGDMVIVAADNKLVFGLDAATGKQLWEYLAPEIIVGQPVVTGKHFVMQVGENSITVLDTATGTPEWEHPQRIFTGIQGARGARRQHPHSNRGRQAHLQEHRLDARRMGGVVREL